MTIYSRFRIGLIKRLIDFNEKIFFERKLELFYKKEFRGNLNSLIDVGANKGQTIDFFLSLNPKCQIYAIEPNPTLYKLLIKKYSRQDNVRIFNVGVSDKSGEKLFFENIFDYTSTFEQLNMDSEYLKRKAKVLGVSPENIVTKSYDVNVVTLHDFISKNISSSIIDILKIDTEGHEYYCLQGLFNDELKTKIKYIQLENHNDDMYNNRIQFTTINSLLNKNKFELIKNIPHGFGDFDEVIYKMMSDIQ